MPRFSSAGSLTLARLSGSLAARDFCMSSSVMQQPPSTLLPGATIGVLGSGQLGRMFAIAARELGFRIQIYSPDNDTPAGHIADREWSGAYDDLEKVREFARNVDVVTFEFENVLSLTTDAVAEVVPVRPGGRVLHITQQRLREKTFLQENGFPVTPFRRVTSLSELQLAAKELGLPAVLKTASFGYDGKGQVKLRSKGDLASAFAALKGAEGIYEAFVDFEKEISVVAARTLNGQFAAFPVFENAHANHILDITFAPAAVSEKLAHDARELARGILEKLDVVGLLTVEMFVRRDGRVLVNELAPRTHNSGHLTIDACVTSQFEQQVRAVCGLPLGSTDLRAPAAMANLLGHLWSNGEPDWVAALNDPRVKLHLYGKAEARVGRKMGHLTATGATVEEAVECVAKARERLLCKAPAASIS
jgi:5-(carboxyamino)imidazole ribonucleotide synthase